MEKEKSDGKTKGCAIVFVIAIILICIFYVNKCSNYLFSDTPKDTTKIDTTMLDIYSRADAEEAIKGLLKAPASAKFEVGEQMASFSGIDDSCIYVNGSVDAQNSFGALIRTKYHVCIKFKNGYYKPEEREVLDARLFDN